MPGFEERRVHPLAPSGPQGVHVSCDDGHRSQDAGGDVGERRPALDRWSAGSLPGYAHHAAISLGDEIEAAQVGVGAGSSESGDLAENESRIFFSQAVVPQAQAFHGACAVVLDGHVSPSEQLPDDLSTGVGFEVDRDAALVAVEHQEGRCFAPDIGRHETARRVALGKLFHLYYVCSEVGEHSPADRSRHDVRQLDYFEAFEGTHRLSVL